MTLTERSDHPAPPRLRVMVRPHELARGGSQINAIDLAARLRDRGHDVEVYAPPGPLRHLIESRDLAYREAPVLKHPSGVRAAASLSREIARFRPDIVHNFESWPTISSAMASVVRPHRAVTTVLSMDVPDYVPHDVPLIVGTAALAAAASDRRDDVHLMEPPIDVEHDAPGDAAAARHALAVASDAFVVSVVGRLSAEHQKAAGIAAAIDELAGDPDLPPTVLLVAGDGDESELVRAAAERSTSDRLTVRLLGDVDDPSGIYDAADVVFGMGSSALRALAHRKPLIVQGRDGFWQLFSPGTVGVFEAQGFFGSGFSGERFGEILAGLRDGDRREELGSYGREVVCTRYSLSRAAEQLEGIYVAELRRARPRAGRLRATLVALLRFTRYRVALAAPVLQRTYRWLTGRRS